MSLHHLRRRQLADIAAGLDLQRGVMDVEAERKLGSDLVQEQIVGAAGPHQMRGQRGFVGAHGPEMEVVHLGDPIESAEIVPHLRQLDASGHAVERETDAVTGKAPAARQYRS